MTKEVPKSKNQNKAYDLKERTARFGENVIGFVSRLKHGRVNDVLTGQLVRCATSVGANYMEADGSSTRKEFNHRVVLCRQEAKETMHWLRMIASANADQREDCRQLYQEAQEFVRIFSTILARSK